MTTGSLNLIKLAVGIEDVEHLAAVQDRRLAESAKTGQRARLFHMTRNIPRRSAELLDGGSIYWVIRGRIRVRQRLLDIEEDADEEGRRYCRLVLSAERIETQPRPHRAIQGWRYLPADSAPPDRIQESGAEEIPAELAAELRELGLL